MGKPVATIDASGIKSKYLYTVLGKNVPLFDLNSTYLSGFKWERKKLYFKVQSKTFSGKKVELKTNMFGNFPSSGRHMAGSAYISGFDVSYKIQRKDMGRIKVRNMNMLYSTAYYSSADEIETQLLSKSDKVIGSKYGDQIYSLGGADKIYGRSGNDKISGGSGNDYIEGGSGDDLIFVSSGLNATKPQNVRIKNDEIPTEDKVAEIFLPINPDFPTPAHITFPLQL